MPFVMPAPKPIGLACKWLWPLPAAGAGRAGPGGGPHRAWKKGFWGKTGGEGPRRFSGTLPHPPQANGKFQNMGGPPEFRSPRATDLPGAKPQPASPPPKPDPTFYGDIKVLAYRLPENEITMADAHPRVTTNARGADTALITDGDFGRPVSLAVSAGEPQVWVAFEFPAPYRAQRI